MRRTARQARPGGLRLLVLLATVAVQTACGTPIEAPVPIRLTMAADRSALVLADELATAYHAAHPHISIEVSPMGNARAASGAILGGPWDLALTTAPTDPPLAPALREEAVAQDALALIVHSSNPLDRISLDQAVALFHGDLRDWSQFGGAPGAIQIITRETASGPRLALEQAVLGSLSLSPMAIVVPSDQQVLETVASDPLAIGYVPASWLDGRVKALDVDGASPRLAGQDRADYPLELPVFLLSSSTPSRKVVDFQRFIASREGQRVIARHFAPPAGDP